MRIIKLTDGEYGLLGEIVSRANIAVREMAQVGRVINKINAAEEAEDPKKAEEPKK